MSNTITSVGGASQSALWGNQFVEIGPISAATWPRWKSKLPGAVAAFSRVPAAQFYLNGRKVRPDYDLSTIDAILDDDVKAKVFDSWCRITDSLKSIVSNWGSGRARAAVELFDTQYGNAPGLWKILNKLGDSGTGAEKIVVLKSLMSREWHEEDDPHVYFADFEAELAQVNAAYKSAAEALAGDDSPDNQADHLAALSLNVARDIVLANLPHDYADLMSPHLRVESTYFDVKDKILQLYATRQSHEAIADLEARRAVAHRVEQPIQAPLSQEAGLAQQDGFQTSAGPPRQHGSSKANSTKDGRKIDVKQLAGFDKWRGGTFTDANNLERFKIPPGTCFACFKEGHRIAQCPSKHEASARALSRVAELRKDGIVVTPEIAVALPLLDLCGDTRLDKAAVQALVVSSGHAHEGNFAHSVTDVSTSSAYRAAVTESASGKYVLDSGATRHFTTRRADLADYVPYTTHHPVGGAFGSKGSAEGEGTLTLTLLGGPLCLKKVMLVPRLGVNLIALNRLMMDGIKVTNSSTTLTLTTQGGKKLVDLKLAPTVVLEMSA
ncbi:hypothetical protein DMC30DRAFT_394841 [Rhodotorula diobovata]|uniref:CCHC-type domain-containing protein n=1 Tax=Rhodotorula diobovata TaxID=5288 RepID=A0A5C5FZB9_9BASI|nr:hypothetical protein DMC30DRAFT_394841 [Rhodotorula diobovata]